MKPKNPLPWEPDEIGDTGGENPVGVYNIYSERNRVAEYLNEGDAKYIAHACNAYPKLVEALREMVAPSSVNASDRARNLLRVLGEDY